MEGTSGGLTNQFASFSVALMPLYSLVRASYQSYRLEFTFVPSIEPALKRGGRWIPNIYIYIIEILALSLGPYLLG